MDIKDIKSLIKFVVETDITEFELATGEEKIRIQRGLLPTFANAPQIVVQQQPAMVSASHDQLPSTAPSQTVLPPATEIGQAITSPIVGTLYRASSPDAAPYVEAGQIVEKGQVLCIVEAMKLMNEIEAEYRCRIVKVCKENAQPVEYGETLFLVEPL